jgi:hypothetical protein
MPSASRSSRRRGNKQHSGQPTANPGQDIGIEQYCARTGNIRAQFCIQHGLGL